MALTQDTRVKGAKAAKQEKQSSIYSKDIHSSGLASLATLRESLSGVGSATNKRSYQYGSHLRLIRTSASM